MLDGLGSSLHVVGAGDRFEAAGFDIQVHGEWHAIIHPDIPRIKNVGYLIDGTLFHPAMPSLCPMRRSRRSWCHPRSWSKISEVIDYVREVAPTQSVAVHDGLLNQFGVNLVGNLLGGPLLGGVKYTRTVPPAELDV